MPLSGAPLVVHVFADLLTGGFAILSLVGVGLGFDLVCRRLRWLGEVFPREDDPHSDAAEKVVDCVSGSN
jgi:hypothetical protein